MTFLAIRYIEDANPAWFRGSDLGPMDELIQSIRQEGVLRPVLLRPDFYLIDGARRIIAAKEAGLDTVPIHMCSKWEDIMDHFRPADPDCYPMDWLTLLEFWNTVLKPVHQDFRFVISARTRKRIESGVEIRQPKPNYSGFLSDLADLWQAQPATVKLFRDYFTRLIKMEDDYPLFVKGVYAALPHGESARSLEHSRVLKAVLENLLHGTLTEDEALEMFRNRLEEVATTGKPRVQRKQGRINHHAPAITNRQLTNLLELLGRIAYQAHEFQNFRITEAEALAAVEALATNVVELQTLRKRLYTVIALHQQQAQSEEQDL